MVQAILFVLILIPWRQCIYHPQGGLWWVIDTYSSARVDYRQCKFHNMVLGFRILKEELPHARNRIRWDLILHGAIETIWCFTCSGDESYLDPDNSGRGHESSGFATLQGPTLLCGIHMLHELRKHCVGIRRKTLAIAPCLTTNCPNTTSSDDSLKPW